MDTNQQTAETALTQLNTLELSDNTGIELIHTIHDAGFNLHYDEASGWTLHPEEEFTLQQPE